MGSADVALSGDSTNSEANKFTEGGLYVSWSPFNIPKDDLSITRKLMIGGFFKVFNTIPHVGFHIGGIETGGKFISTYIFVGVMTRLIKVNNEANTNISAPKDYMNNFYIEFAIHSQHVDILKNLRIKGGILIPAWFSKGFDGIKSQDIISRIVIEFPLGGVFSF